MKIIDIERVETNDNYYVSFIVTTDYVQLKDGTLSVLKGSLPIWSRILNDENFEAIIEKIAASVADRFYSRAPDTPHAHIKHLIKKKARSMPDGFFAGLSDERIQKIQQIHQMRNDLAALAGELPGVQANVLPPCSCPHEVYNHGYWTLMEVITHLNDYHRLTREKIADWLDDVHESGRIDLEFKTP